VPSGTDFFLQKSLDKVGLLRQESPLPPPRKSKSVKLFFLKKFVDRFRKFVYFFSMKYVIAHWTKTSFLGKSGWTNKSFARRFDSFEDAEEFCAMCGLDEQGVWIEAV